MNPAFNRIPTHDILGKKVRIGEEVTLFSRHDTHYDGVVVQRGGKRWVQIDEGAWIGGIGNCLMIKDTGRDQDGRM